jgi:hypothetical protein
MQQIRSKLMAAMLAAFTLTGATAAFAQGPGRGAEFEPARLSRWLLELDRRAEDSGASHLRCGQDGLQQRSRPTLLSSRRLARRHQNQQPDSELERLAAAVGTIQGQLTGIQAKASAKFYALLTAEQKTKYDARSEHGPRGPR